MAGSLTHDIDSRTSASAGRRRLGRRRRRWQSDGRGAFRRASFTGLYVLLAASTMLFAAFTSAMVVRRGLSDDWVSMPKPPILLAQYGDPAGIERGPRSGPPRAEIPRTREVQRLVDRRHCSRHALPLRTGPRLEPVERRERLHFHQSEQFVFLRADRRPRGPPAGRSQLRCSMSMCRPCGSVSGRPSAPPSMSARSSGIFWMASGCI